jgi:hypothetical protein
VQTRFAVLLLVITLLTADAPPPLPAPPPPSAPWACDRQTLLRGLPCSFEGLAPVSTTPDPQRRLQNQQQARAVGVDLCAAIGGEAAVVRACVARVEVAVGACGGDGTVAFVDDDGRFDAGHGACYRALRDVVVAASAVAFDAASCCDCLDADHGAAFDRCVVDVDHDDLPAGAAGLACRSSCAAILLRVPATTTTTTTTTTPPTKQEKKTK